MGQIYESINVDLNVQMILFNFTANSLLTFSTVVRLILPMLLLSASKRFSVFIFFSALLFILPSAFLMDSLFPDFNVTLWA